ncbi:hypothetical protein N42HA_00142 [Lactococcus lactis]|nr:hypothetical protein [Lactococcus lactis]
MLLCCSLHSLLFVQIWHYQALLKIAFLKKGNTSNPRPELTANQPSKLNPSLSLDNVIYQYYMRDRPCLSCIPHGSKYDRHVCPNSRNYGWNHRPFQWLWTFDMGTLSDYIGRLLLSVPFLSRYCNAFSHAHLQITAPICHCIMLVDVLLWSRLFCHPSLLR